ncbi:MAG: M28 family peptidase [Clostridiales bacterium]|nr:M28 family peptidase [Clostridiales bacterium]
MKEENRKYAQEAYDIVKYAAKEVGSRLPGSEGEKKYADYMGDKLREIGIEPKQEEFAVSPRSAIGGLSYAGWVGVILSGLVYIALGISAVWYAMAFIAAVAVFWLFSCCFLYHTWSDMFFPQAISQNTYGELVPPDGKYDYTIILSGHTDTSWCWRHSEHSYKYKDKPILGLLATYIKVGFGAVCFFAIALFSIFMGVLLTANHFNAEWTYVVLKSPFFQDLIYAMHFIPAVTALGSFFVVMWGDPNGKNASKGAMDNATGCALSYEVIKYFKENPDKMPKNCRIVDFNCGSEEAGLRGSMAFAQEHKNDDLTKNAWNINIDSVADEDYFEVVIKDDWQNCRFDTDLERMFKESFNEFGIESKTKGCIHNPVGGCDSTPMTRAGIKSVTFAAQNPMLTYYYHTWRDTPERFSMETVGTGFDVVLNVIDKIADFQDKNGFNGPQKK